MGEADKCHAYNLGWGKLINAMRVGALCVIL